jgi:hypothetical protein
MTSDGRDYLEQVDGPNAPKPRQANVSVTWQLIDEVVVAGGTLRVPRRNWYDAAGIDYAHRARLAATTIVVCTSRLIPIRGFLSLLRAGGCERLARSGAVGAARTPPTVL